jgi:molybdopterin-guanine dinucleotide biosynthesis protein A
MDETMITDVTGIVLAGGKSRRMGKDKRFLLVGGRQLYERSLVILQSLFQEVRIVIAQDSSPLSSDVPVLRDLVPNCGTLGGIYTGLKEAATEHIFAVACDMPFLNIEVIRYLVSLKGTADIVIVCAGDRLQPTHAVYGRRCLPIFEEMVRAGGLKVQDIVGHPSLTVRVVDHGEIHEIDPEGHSFLNVNTPADLEAVRLLPDQPTESHPSG